LFTANTGYARFASCNGLKAAQKHLGARVRDYLGKEAPSLHTKYNPFNDPVEGNGFIVKRSDFYDWTDEFDYQHLHARAVKSLRIL